MKHILIIAFVTLLIFSFACGKLTGLLNEATPVFALVSSSPEGSPLTTMRVMSTESDSAPPIALSPSPDVQHLLTDTFTQFAGYRDADAELLFSQMQEHKNPAAIVYDNAALLSKSADAFNSHVTSLLSRLQSSALACRALAVEEAEDIHWHTLAVLGYAFGEDCFDKLIAYTDLISDYSSYIGLRTDYASLYNEIPKERVLGSIFLYAALGSFVDEEDTFRISPICSDFSGFTDSVVSPCEWTNGYEIWPDSRSQREPFCGVRFHTLRNEFCAVCDSKVLFSGNDERYGAWVMLGDIHGNMYIYAGLAKSSTVTVGNEYMRGQIMAKADAANGAPYLYMAVLNPDYVFVDAYDLFLSLAES